MQIIKCENARIERRCAINKGGDILAAKNPGENAIQFFNLSAGEYPPFTPIIVEWEPSIFRMLGNNDGLALETFGDMALVSDETVHDLTVGFYGVTSGRMIDAIGRFRDHPASMAFSCDGGYFLVGGNERTVTEWDANKLKYTKCGFSLRQGNFRIVHYSHDSRLAVISYSMGGYGAYDLSSKSKDKHFRRSEAIPEEFVTVFDNGTKLLSKSGSALGVFDIQSGELITTYRYHSDVISGIFADPDKNLLFSAQWAGSSEVAVWDFKRQKVVSVLCGHTSEVRAISMNHDRTRVITGENKGIVKLWDAQTLECIESLDLKLEILSFTPVLENGRFYARTIASKSILIEL